MEMEYTAATAAAASAAASAGGSSGGSGALVEHGAPAERQLSAAAAAAAAAAAVVPSALWSQAPLWAAADVAQPDGGEAANLPVRGRVGVRVGVGVAVRVSVGLSPHPHPTQAANFPVGVCDVNGQQIDTRRTNSWLLKLDEVRQ